MKRCITIALLFVSGSSWAQQRPEIDLELFAESLFQLQDQDINYEELYESLLMYYTSPINLNNTNHEELAALCILSPSQLNHFFTYLEINGKLLSLYELQAIPGFDLETIHQLLPFVTVHETSDGRPLWVRVLNEDNNYLLLRYSRTLQAQEGFRRENGSGYVGDRNTLYGRFRISQPDDFSAGITFEKDAGEKFGIDPSSEQYGFDYYSFHFLLENTGKMKRLAIGDYQLQFGQGLVLGSGFGTGKGSETTNSTKRNTVGIRPYSSVLESGFFRGAAVTLAFGRWETTAFASHLRQDGNLLSDTTYSDFDEHVNAIQATGYHRTTAELSAKNQITETSGGFALNYKLNPRFSLGGTGLFSYYSRPLQKKPNNYNQFEFSGNKNALISMYASFNWQNFIFFGESGISASGGTGAVSGLIASLTPRIDFSFLMRTYARNFHTFYGNAFGEGSRTINESGMYWGLKFRPLHKCQVSLYFDKFRFPWLKYRVDAPSKGFEYLGRITYSPSRTIRLYAQYRSEHKEMTTTSEGSNLSILTPVMKRNYVFNVDYKLGRFFSMKTRAQGSAYSQDQKKTTKGFALVQDISLAYWKLKGSTRFALFDTDDFTNSQYIYERDVLYAFSVPAYFGTGIRSYFLLQYKVSRPLSIWLRYASFSYENQDTIGSGLGEIAGNERSELKLMIRYRFM